MRRCTLSVLLLLTLPGCESSPESRTVLRTQPTALASALDIENLKTTLASYFPDRPATDEKTYSKFLMELRYFKVLTVEELKKVIVQNLAFAERVEENKFAAIKKRALRGKAGDSPEMSRGYYHSDAGMGRLALGHHVGEGNFERFQLQVYYAERRNQPAKRSEPNKTPDRTRVDAAENAGGPPQS